MTGYKVHRKAMLKKEDSWGRRLAAEARPESQYTCTNCTKYVRKNCEKLQNLNSGIAIIMWQVYI